MSEDKSKGTEDITDDVQEEDSTDGSEVSIETLQVQKRKALEQRDKERAEKEELLKKLAEVSNKPETKPTSQPNNDEYVTRLDRIEFAQSHPELGADVVQEVLDLAKSKGIKAEDALELPMVKTYVDSVKADRAVAYATPTGGRSPRVQPKKPVNEMSREERMEHLKKLVG